MENFQHMRQFMALADGAVVFEEQATHIVEIRRTILDDGVFRPFYIYLQKVDGLLQQIGQPAAGNADGAGSALLDVASRPSVEAKVMVPLFVQTASRYASVPVSPLSCTFLSAIRSYACPARRP